jgi:hypothetical protein
MTTKTTTKVIETNAQIAPTEGPRYLYEVWVSDENFVADTEHFPASVAGFIDAFKASDARCDIANGVTVYVHRWDYASTSFDRVRSDEGFAFVGFDDEGDPSEIDTDLVDDDGAFLNRLPKSIIAAFEKARVAYVGR